MSITEVIVMLDGAVGVVNVTLDNLKDLLTLLPQLEVYATLTLSPVEAAALLANFILTMRDVNVPESNTAVNPKVPTNYH